MISAKQKRFNEKVHDEQQWVDYCCAKIENAPYGPMPFRGSLNRINALIQRLKEYGYKYKYTYIPGVANYEHCLTVYW